MLIFFYDQFFFPFSICRLLLGNFYMFIKVRWYFSSENIFIIYLPFAWDWWLFIFTIFLNYIWLMTIHLVFVTPFFIFILNFIKFTIIKLYRSLALLNYIPNVLSNLLNTYKAFSQTHLSFTMLSAYSLFFWFTSLMFLI